MSADNICHSLSVLYGIIFFTITNHLPILNIIYDYWLGAGGTDILNIPFLPVHCL